MSRISEQLKASNWDNLLTLGSLQFRSFLVYWSKLTKCLCYQMLKVHSACGIEHQVLSGVEAGLGSGFQNTTVTCHPKKILSGMYDLAKIVQPAVCWWRSSSSWCSDEGKQPGSFSASLFQFPLPPTHPSVSGLAAVSHPPTFHTLLVC